MQDKFDNIDELLKKSLDDFQQVPSPGVWRRINIRLALSGTKYLLIVVSILVFMALGVFFIFNSDNTETTNQNTISTEEEMEFTSIEDNNDIESDNIPESRTEQQIPEKNSEPASQGNENNIRETGVQKTDSEPEVDFVAESIPVYTLQSEAKTESAVVKMDHFNQYPGLERLSQIPEIQNKEINRAGLNSVYFNWNIIQGIDLRNGAKFTYPEDVEDYNRNLNLTYGAHVSMEWIFMNDPDRTIKNAYNIDFTGIYYKNDWLIQSGVGVSLSEDDGLYQVDYMQNDSIGYYYQVNGFTIDPQTGQPVYKTSIENVYDTVDYNESAKVKNSYTYLRIPVYAGIRAYQDQRFSIFLKGGLIYAIMIAKNEPGYNYQNENALNIKINNNSGERVRSYFQASVALGAEYLISNKLSLSLEPVFNYYVQPVYINRYQSGSPYSLGVKTGILFKF